MKNILARTLLLSHSGKEYIYEIYLRISPDTGNVEFVSEQGQLLVRPYMLLQLLDDVFDSFNAPFLSSGDVATLRYNKGGHKKNQASLETSCGRRYRLKQEVDGKWLNTVSSPDMHEMIRFFHGLKSTTRTSNAISLPGSVRNWHNPEWIWREVIS